MMAHPPVADRTMPYVARALLVFSLALAALPARAQDVTNAADVPHLAPADRPQYQRFLAAREHRAFAIGPDGEYGWSADRDGWFMAELGAVYNCNKAGKVLCEIYAVDSDLMIASYAGNENAGLGLLSQLRGRQLSADYDNELEDEGVAPTRQLHGGNAAGATPASIPGGRLITTRYLAEALSGASPPLLIDVGDDGGLHATLPRAIWMRGAGDDAGAANASLDQLFRALLARVAPNRNTPIVLFCTSPRCWAAYNAALRAISSGHINVYWYRGGVAAWEAADLPIVQAVLVAQLW
jgi:PQQ-dependent catabolism-associated CXXCW motif protein